MSEISKPRNRKEATMRTGKVAACKNAEKQPEGNGMVVRKNEKSTFLYCQISGGKEREKKRVKKLNDEETPSEGAPRKQAI